MLKIIAGSTLRRILLVGAGAAIALLLALGAHSGAGPQADAADPDLEFNMEITSGSIEGICNTKLDPAPIGKGAVTCRVPLNGTFVAEVRLDDPGAASGQVSLVQGVIGWTAGLEGPGDPGSTKGMLAPPSGSCSTQGFHVKAAPFPGPRMAGTACQGFPPPLTDAQATAYASRFELTCGPSASQELVTMIADGSTPGNGTYMGTSATELSDKDGSEIITILCGDQPAPPIPTPVPTATPVSVGGLAELPDVAGAPLQSEAGSGANILLVALVTVVAATVATGAGWYARRRWGG